MCEEGEESGSASSTTALHGAGRHIEHASRLRHRIALHVHQDEGCALVGGKRAERGYEFAVQVVALGRSGSRLVRLEELFQTLGVVDGEVRRDAVLRARSRHAFTVMRCSQVVTAD